MKLEYVYKQRLLKLADFIEQKQTKFNLDYIVDFDEDVIKNCKIPNNQKFKQMLKKHECGTACCAIGSLPLVFPKHFEYDILGLDTDNDVRIKVISSDGRIDVNAAEHFLGLTKQYQDKFYLFYPNHYRPGHRGPKSVANRIREYVAKDGNINRNTKAYLGEYPQD